MCYLLNDKTDLHFSGLGALVPEAPWDVFYATRHQVYCRFNINDTAFTNTLIWYHQHKQLNSSHTGTNRLTHKYILTPPVRFSQQVPELHWINYSLILNFFYRGQQYLFFSKSTYLPRHILERQGLRAVWIKKRQILVHKGQFKDETPPNSMEI